MSYFVKTSLASANVQPDRLGALVALLHAFKGADPKDADAVVASHSPSYARWRERGGNNTLGDLKGLRVLYGKADLTGEREVNYGGGEEVALTLSDFLTPGALLYSQDDAGEVWAFRLDGPGAVVRLDGEVVLVDRTQSGVAVRRALEAGVVSALSDRAEVFNLDLEPAVVKALGEAVVEALVGRLEPGDLVRLLEERRPR